jgi:SAM-dependent methyltransferase
MKLKYRFNPQDYLAANPDAVRAIEEGREPSAWSHFVNGGYREERPGVPNAIRKTVLDVMAAPPARVPPAGVLQGLQGTADAGAFQALGRGTALDVYAAVAPFIYTDRPLRILDFGCGYGCVARFLSEVAPVSMIRAVDGDPDAIRWCSENYRGDVRRGRYEFIDRGEAPPLPYSDNFFDLVCAISAFVGMPERRKLVWLADLKRITKPLGLVALAAQGDAPWPRYFEILETFPRSNGDPAGLALCRKRLPLVI